MGKEGVVKRGLLDRHFGRGVLEPAGDLGQDAHSDGQPDGADEQGGGVELRHQEHRHQRTECRDHDVERK